MITPIKHILSEIEAGRPVIVVDDEDRENEGDIVVAAQFATPEIINFMITQGRGLVCVPMDSSRIELLGLEPMRYENDDPFKTAWTVSVDAAKGVTTGISAHDRAKTVQVLIDDTSIPKDLNKPGHIFPLKAKPGGVLVRSGHTEAVVDLARLAGLKPAGVICEIVNDDGTMARMPDLIKFSKRHNIKMCTIADLIEYRRQKERLVNLVSKVNLPTEFGDFDLYLYETVDSKEEHVALVKGEITSDPLIVRVHSECLTGDAFLSKRCDCGIQLHDAMRIIARKGGVVLYMRQEGRGIGLKAKMKAYELQDNGADTVQANEMLGFSADLRHYGIGAQILVDLGVKKIRLLTNNPKKIVGLEGYGLEVTERIGIGADKCEHNSRYLDTKKAKLDHII